MQTKLEPLQGWRMWAITREGVLVAPYHTTTDVWEDGVQIATCDKGHAVAVTEHLCGIFAFTNASKAFNWAASQKLQRRISHPPGRGQELIVGSVSGLGTLHPGGTSMRLTTARITALYPSCEQRAHYPNLAGDYRTTIIPLEHTPFKTPLVKQLKLDAAGLFDYLRWKFLGPSRA